MDRRTLMKGVGASILLAATGGCTKKSEPNQVKPKTKAIVRPKIEKSKIDPAQELIQKSFIDPLRQDLKQIHGDRKKILDAIALRTNETLNELVSKFSVRTAQAQFKDIYVKLQQKAMQALLSEMVTVLRQMNFVEGEGFERLLESGYLYNQNFIEMLNRGQMVIPEDYKLNNDEANIELFSKIASRGNFELVHNKELFKLFEDLGLKPNPKSSIQYSVINSDGVSFLGLNYKGNIVLNLQRIKMKAKAESKSVNKLALAVLANEVSHRLVKDRYGSQGIPAELDEFISDIATAAVDAQQIIHDRLDVSNKSNYVLSRNEIFTTILDILEEKQSRPLMRRAYAEQGGDFIEREIAKAFPGETYSKKFVPEFQKRLKEKAISMLMKRP